MRRQRAGFTLMETLVMLIVSALAVMLMFQSLASFNHARERIGAFEGVRGNQIVLDGWIADSMAGLVAFDPAGLPTGQAADPDRSLHGDARGFVATSTSPLLGPPGVPTQIGWQVEPSPSGVVLVYRERGHEPLRFPMDGPLAFQYLDAEGKPQTQWPPKLGTPQALPVAVELSVGEGPRTRVIAAAVAHPRPLPLPPYGPDVEQ